MNIRILNLALGLTLFLLSSCSKAFQVGDELIPREKVDLTSSKVYLSTPTFPQGSVSPELEFAQTPSKQILKKGLESTTFSVRLSRPTNKDVTVKLSIVDDEQSLSVYKASSSFKNEVITPLGGMTLDKTSVVIKAGKSVSDDLVTVQLGEQAKLSSLDAERLVTLIKIVEVSEGAKVSSNLGLFFVPILKLKTNVKSTRESNLNGKTKINISGFTFTQSKLPSWGGRFGSDKVYDNNRSTFWANEKLNPTDRTSWYQVEFPERTLVGIKFGIPTSYTYWTPRAIELWTQDSSNKWEKMATIDLPGSADPYNSLEFYEPIRSKGLRIVVLSTFNTNQLFIALGELELYQ